mgnify:CR=1 FL=1
MKRIITAMILILLGQLIYSQTISSYLISSAGNNLNGSGYTYDYSAGELSVSHYQGSSYTISEGFHSGYLNSKMKELKIKMILEGLYTGTGMRKVKDSLNYKYQGDTVDLITISLRGGIPHPCPIIDSIPGVALLQNDTAYCQIPDYITGNYYLVVNHRNSIETWSAAPITFKLDESSFYDFTIDSLQAYGNNLKRVNIDKYAIYTGDVNQDGISDTLDISSISSNAAVFKRKYNNTDLNGDGITDALDLILCDNNISLRIHAIKP